MSSLLAFDRLVFNALNGLHAPWLEPIVIAASYLGVGGAIWFATALLLFFSPSRRPAAWRLILGILLAQITVDLVLKPIIGRDRPFVGHDEIRVLLMPGATPSFPSGHATQAIVGAAAASLAVPSLRIAWWSLAAVIAVSRIFVGAHFPLDVLAGILLGAFLARLVLKDVKPDNAPFAPGPVPGTAS